MNDSKELMSIHEMNNPLTQLWLHLTNHCKKLMSRYPKMNSSALCWPHRDTSRKHRNLSSLSEWRCETDCSDLLLKTEWKSVVHYLFDSASIVLSFVPCGDIKQRQLKFNSCNCSAQYSVGSSRHKATVLRSYSIQGLGTGLNRLTDGDTVQLMPSGTHPWIIW